MQLRNGGSDGPGAGSGLAPWATMCTRSTLHDHEKQRTPKIQDGLTLQIVKHSDTRTFQKLAVPLFARSEAQYCLPIGIVDTLINHPDRYPEFHLFTVNDGETLAGAAWMTPPHPLGITAMPAPALEALADKVAGLRLPVTGVLGPRPAVDTFAALWTARTGAKVHNVQSQRIYQLSKVKKPRPVQGMMTEPTARHRDLLVEWSHQFSVDCGQPPKPGQMDEVADFALKTKTRVFWEIGGHPVAMAGYGGQTATGVRINWVFTPPENRGKGYASALVATLSQVLLDEGRKFCFLYTDLANPTANGIYQKIGYAPVCDSAHHFFA